MMRPAGTESAQKLIGKRLWEAIGNAIGKAIGKAIRSRLEADWKLIATGILWDLQQLLGVCCNLKQCGAKFGNLWQFLHILATYGKFQRTFRTFCNFRELWAIWWQFCLEDKSQCCCVCTALLGGQKTALLSLHCFPCFAQRIKASVAVLALLYLEDKRQRCCVGTALLEG